MGAAYPIQSTKIIDGFRLDFTMRTTWTGPERSADGLVFIVHNDLLGNEALSGGGDSPFTNLSSL